MNIFTLLLLTTITVNQAQSQTTQEQQMTIKEAIEATLETQANSSQKFSELVKSTIRLMGPAEDKGIQKNQ